MKKALLSIVFAGALVMTGIIAEGSLKDETFDLTIPDYQVDEYPNESAWSSFGSTQNMRTDVSYSLVIDQLSERVSERIVYLDTPQEFEDQSVPSQTQNAQYQEPGLFLEAPDPGLGDAEDGIYTTNITQQRGTVVSNMKNVTIDVQVDSLNPQDGGLWLQIEDESGNYTYSLESGLNRFDAERYYNDTQASDKKDVEYIRGVLNGSDATAEIDYVDAYVPSGSNARFGTFDSDVFMNQNTNNQLRIERILVDTTDRGELQDKQMSITYYDEKTRPVYAQNITLNRGASTYNIEEPNTDYYGYDFSIYVEADGDSYSSPQINRVSFDKTVYESLVQDVEFPINQLIFWICILFAIVISMAGVTSEVIS